MVAVSRRTTMLNGKVAQVLSETISSVYSNIGSDRRPRELNNFEINKIILLTKVPINMVFHFALLDLIHVKKIKI